MKAIFDLLSTPKTQKVMANIDMFMSPTQSISLFLGASAAVLSSLSAQTSVSTDPVGAIKLEVPAGTDALASVPLHGAPVFQGAIEGFSGFNEVEFAEGVGWTVDEFADKYFALVTSGEMEGAFAIIIENGTDSLTLSYVSEDFDLGEAGGVQLNDRISVIPLWTLGTLFEGSDVPNGLEVLFYDRAQVGVNNSPSNVVEYFEGHGWYSGAEFSDGHPIYPDESFVVRTPSSAALELVVTGSVMVSKFRFNVALVDELREQDIRISTHFPVPIELSEIFDEASVSEGDQLFFYDTEQVGVNKSPYLIARYYGSYGWYAGSVDMNDHMLSPGDGLVYRKAVNGVSSSVVSVPSPLGSESE